MLSGRVHVDAHMPASFCDCTNSSAETLNYYAPTMLVPQAADFKWTSKEI